jgi:hypothetical protein
MTSEADDAGLILWCGLGGLAYYPQPGREGELECFLDRCAAAGVAELVFYFGCGGRRPGEDSELVLRLAHVGSQRLGGPGRAAPPRAGPGTDGRPGAASSRATGAGGRTGQPTRLLAGGWPARRRASRPGSGRGARGRGGCRRDLPGGFGAGIGVVGPSALIEPAINQFQQLLFLAR